MLILDMRDAELWTVPPYDNYSNNICYIYLLDKDRYACSSGGAGSKTMVSLTSQCVKILL